MARIMSMKAVSFNNDLREGLDVNVYLINLKMYYSCRMVTIMKERNKAIFFEFIYLVNNSNNNVL
jgi:hypothetical protein